ncbi:MAG: hypothetical protein KDD14_26350, partial [Saprospiraceae bacterium]|nr:hypothetical protein [Saprospiraceae bacterium]
RTQAEIQENLCGDMSVPQTGLLAYYKFYHGSPNGDNTGINTLANSANANAYVATLHNFALSGSASNWTDPYTAGLGLPAIRYVKQGGAGDGTSWANASGDLQAMIDECGVEQVWVAAGVYKPTAGADRNISFTMKNNVAIYGGFPNTGNPGTADRDWTANTTTLSGDIDGNNTLDNGNSLHVIVNSSLNNSAVLDGFTIRGGYDD